MKTLTKALTASKVAGEEPTTIETPSISVAVSRKRPEHLANKTFKIGDSEVVIPPNMTAFGNKTLDVEVRHFVRVWMLKFLLIEILTQTSKNDTFCRVYSK